MDLFSEHAAAIHEAAHAVVAHHGGLEGSEIAIEYSKELERWAGRFQPIPLDPSDFFAVPHYLSTAARVAVAGALAQAKFCVEEVRCSRIRFDPQSNLASLVPFLVDNRRTEEKPGVFCFGFVGQDDHSVRFERTFDGRIYSSQDSKMLNQSIKIIANLDVMNSVRDVMTLLDVDANWAAVNAVATRLLRRFASGADGTRHLSQVDFKREIESI